ncbi:MAG: TlpA disulfide reductase family protein [Methylotenera sp.]|uniref:TlpA family protein disulfide reductase n=1 Tax=Methylotenera sp. TaxID=2051956 RepID=UPI00185076AF|nr:TlpA disulfide reductase family protein [Methylotenera sp.]NOU25021.1 TlpA family protein disulfide reductase [Methylotenera sp.]
MKVIAIIFCSLLCISTSTFANTPGEIEVGSYLKEVTLNGFSGKSKKLSVFRGKPLIINVWASWCGPCREEMGSLERLARRFNGKQLNIIGISTDDDASAALGFINDTKLSFANYLDHNLILENMLGANTIPLTILVDAQGRVVKKVRGSKEWDSPESLKLIEQSLWIKLK